MSTSSLNPEDSEASMAVSLGFESTFQKAGATLITLTPHHVGVFMEAPGLNTPTNRNLPPFPTHLALMVAIPWS